ncbi:putative enzyme [uncultured delta proteobacterium]|uniref:Acetyltransferase n=1 Tax=uncultured delta proteobacterium TaxID=34034 RepID=A0A212KCT4_9DELT|nr:putative enzyme [uncultured delta proteobacterium]
MARRAKRREKGRTMTEKEKAAAGLLYDGNYEPGMMAERIHAASLCQRYNTLPPGSREEQRAVMRELLGKTGDDFLIVQPFYCDYGYNITIGERFFANVNCVILDAAPVVFGDNVFIGPTCGFYTAGHPLNVIQRNQGLEYAYPIAIGNNVWIGGNAVFMPGVTVGDNVVVGAGSVVTRSIPANTVAVGNPCRVLRDVTAEELGLPPAF